MNGDGSVTVDRSELGAFCRALLEPAGARSEHAGVVADHLVEADAMGLHSHGVIRIPQYLDDIVQGGIDPASRPRVEQRTPGRSHVDGACGFGQVAAAVMTREAVRLAGGVGIGFVTGRNMGHTGRIGADAEAMACAGCLGLAVCSGPRAGHWVAPFGGIEGRLATNPVAYAFPLADAPRWRPTSRPAWCPKALSAA
jgi:LDH2 family malate/lactate/ureidoglycolate dehydrogenase